MNNNLRKTMLNSITNHSVSYATQAATDSMSQRAASAAQRNLGVEPDVFERSDGTVVTRFDQPQTETLAEANDKQFRELLHQFIGQTLFGQMLKSMRATQEKNPFFHGGQSEEIYQSLLDMELTEQMTKASSRTISEPMYKLMKAPKMK
jgi:hypothetical protein